MKRRESVKIILLILYLFFVLGIYSWLVYPAIEKPKNLSPTKIISLSVTNILNTNKLLTNFGKVWDGAPTEPDLNNYVFGQKDPL